MTLRRRLAATVLLAVVPLLGALVWVQDQLSRRAMEDAARVFTHARMDAAGRERCEADPVHLQEGWRRPPGPEARPGGPGPGGPSLGGPGLGGFGDGGPRPGGARGRPPRSYAYTASLEPADPSAPALTDGIRRRLAAGAEVASAGVGDELLVAMRMSWSEGPCAVIATLGGPPPRFGPGLGLLPGAALLALGVLAAVLLSAGPVVRRIRNLTRDVGRSVAGGYTEPVRVEGGDEVAELARAFNEAAAEVRAQLRTAREREETLRGFLANTTHDLMLPLTVLQGHLARLKQLPAGEPHARLVAAAAEETGYVASLLENLSAAAKLEAGEPLLQRHAFDLGALVERVVARHRPIASSRGIEIGHAVPEAPTLIDGDVTLVEQSVGNLVHNAVRHNRSGGHVAVVLDEADSGRFALRVSDDGPGVPADELARLGERRFRTDEARSRHPEGLGLGLSIAREVALRHGFELAFSPNEPTGLIAELRGPRAPAEADAARP